MPALAKNRLSPTRRQRGVALMLLLMLVSVGALAVFVSGLNRATLQLERDRITAAALAQAKEALIGYAATYRDTHPDIGGNRDKLFGYLPCPDTNNDGFAEPSCGSKDVSVIGRLPWKTLGLPPLRDGSGECLWYAVSGRFKNNTKTDVLNWDTLGQLNIQDAAGVALFGAAAAVIFSPHGIIGSQDRYVLGTSECGGNTTIAAYLDGSDPLYAGTAPAANATSTLTFSTIDSVKNATNNDQGLWLSTNEIFDRIKRRSDFATDITNMLNDIKDQASKNSVCIAVATIKSPKPAPVIDEPGVLLKSVGFAPDIYQLCISSDATRRMNVFDNWRNNVLYAVCPGGAACLSVNGDANCAAVAIFSGEKTSGKLRPSDKSINYLEGVNLFAFTSSSTMLVGTGPYAYKSSLTDIALCIPPASSTCAANSAILISKVDGSANDCKSGATVLQSCIDAANQLASCSCAADAEAFITMPCINNLNPVACQSAISHLQACSS